MNEQAIKEYLGEIEAAKRLGDAGRSAEVFERARAMLYEAGASESADAAAALEGGNPFYEEMNCFGFYPQERRLEACVELKQPFGYAGNLGAIGSYEYVAFYVNWNGDGDFNDTGEDVGAGYVHVFDPGAQNQRALPICYAAYRDIIPLPTTPPGAVVRARAIRSWQVRPTGPNFVPVWGNILEGSIRIDPIE